MDSDTDEDDSGLNPFIVPDSQVSEEEANKEKLEQPATSLESKFDSHVSVLRELDISKLPETPSHLQGSDEEKLGKPSPVANLEQQLSEVVHKTSGAEHSDFDEDLSEVIPIKDQPLKTKFLNTSCESASSVVSTVSYKSQLSSEEIASASLAEVVSQKQKEPDKDTSTFSSSTGTSVELNRVASDMSEISTNSSENVPSAKTPQPFLDLSRISTMYQTSIISSGDKSTSSTSLRPLTSASSHLSQDTPSIPSSPEFRVPGKAPLHKAHSSSSSGESSFEETKGPSRKKMKLDIIKENDSHGPASSSASFHEDSSHEHGTQSGLSSREVTHLEPPHLRSTPNETSFECLQLSGEIRRPVTSVYSLPDPLPSSPSVLLTESTEVTPAHFSELETRRAGGEGSKNIKRKDGTDTKAYKKPYGSHIALPKWVKADIERKKIEFESSTDSAHLSSSSSPATSPPYGKMTSTSTQSSIFNLSSTAASSDVAIQCVLDRSAYSEPSSSQGKAIEESSEDKQVDVKSNDQRGSQENFVKERVAVTEREEQSNQSSDRKAPLDAKPVSECTGSTNERKMLGSSLTPDKDDMPQSQDSDMEIEMSQDLFNPRLTGSNTGTNPSTESGNKKHSRPLQSQDEFQDAAEDIPEERAQDFSLFLSQTQHETEAKESRLPDMIKPDEPEDACAGFKMSGSQRLDSLKTTPSQSIIPLKSQGTSHPSKEPENEVSKKSRDNLRIPKEVFDKVVHGSSDSSTPNLFHMSLPPEGEQFHPIKTLTPPLRNVEYQGGVSQDYPDEGASNVAYEDSEQATSQQSAANFKTRKDKDATVREKTGQQSDVKDVLQLSEQKSEASSNFDLGEQSETIYAKAMRLSKNKKKRDTHPQLHSESDPFAFPESQDAPLSKRRKLNSAQDRPSPVLPLSGEQNPDSPAEESETFCKAVVHVTTEEEIVRTVKRKIVTEFYSLETGELLKTKTSEFEQTEAPEKTLNVRKSTPTYEIVSFRSICLDSSEDDRKGMKTPTRTDPCSSIRTSPRFKRRSSSSTSLEGVPGVPKARPTKTSTPSSSKQKSKKEENSRARMSSSNSHKSATPARAIVDSMPPVTEKQEDADKSEYEKLLELALAEERVERRETRSSVRGSAERESIEKVQVGARGFGKWLDGCYYPGTIAEKINSDRYKIEFHDGKQLVLAANALVLVDVLPVGLAVFAQDKEEECYVAGKVSVVRRQKKDIHYEIKLTHDGSSKIFKSSELMLDTKQINNLKSQMAREKKSKSGWSKSKEESSKACEASIKNQDFDKDPSGGSEKVISTIHQEKQEAIDRNNAGVKISKRLDRNNDRIKVRKIRSRIKRLKEKREKQLNSVKSSTSPDEGESSKLPPKRQKRVDSPRKIYTALVQPRKKTKDPVQRNEDRLKRIERLKLKQEDPDFVRLYGRLPEDPALFKGYCFLITYVAPKQGDLEPDIALTCEGFQRSYLGCQIVAGGGTIADSVHQLVKVPKEKIILIAPTSQKTLKYYFALSYGVPCLSHSWIKECCEKSCLVAQHSHRLEAGIDQLTGTVVDPHNRTQPLRGIKIFLQVLKEDKEELSLAVRFAGAEIVTKLPNKVYCENEGPPCNYILVGDNATVKRLVKTRSRMFDIKCVSIKWFYQCLILGEHVDPRENTVFMAR
ncbi:TP53-binding protein 1-like isoform X2 [Rhopilema esculentum]|uniref:TP53-binding protein 1-like isoform X2 n=1 Tax=Rhopilema esculentum TaxID=499914 RepID=UPI0031CE899B